MALTPIAATAQAVTIQAGKEGNKAFWGNVLTSPFLLLPIIALVVFIALRKWMQIRPEPIEPENESEDEPENDADQIPAHIRELIINHSQGATAVAAPPVQEDVLEIEEAMAELGIVSPTREDIIKIKKSVNRFRTLHNRFPGSVNGDYTSICMDVFGKRAEGKYYNSVKSVIQAMGSLDNDSQPML